MTRLIRLGVRDCPKARQVPRAPLLAPGVTSYDVASRPPSEGVTPPSSLIRTHASDQIPLTGFGSPYSGESLQVVVSPCWEVALPSVISAIRVWVHGPLPRSAPSVHIPVSSRETSAFSASGSARHSTTIRTATSVRGRISELSVILSCSGLRICSPPGSLLPQCCHWAAVAFTSEPITVCYLPAHRIC
jgi:hypothetical protein